MRLEDYATILVVGSLVLVSAGAIGIVVVGILPTVFIINGDWIAFMYWFPIAVSLGRILGILMLVFGPIVGIVLKQSSWPLVWILTLIMVVWGYPMFLSSGLALAQGVAEEGMNMGQTVLRYLEAIWLNLMISISSLRDANKQSIKPKVKVKATIIPPTTPQSI